MHEDNLVGSYSEPDDNSDNGGCISIEDVKASINELRSKFVAGISSMEYKKITIWRSLWTISY